MKIGKKWFLLPAALSCCFLVFCFNASGGYQSKTTEEDENIIQRVQEILSWRHINPKALDDSFSLKVFNRYLNNLDPNKRFFLQHDLSSFETYKYQMDEFFKNGSLDFYNASIDSLYQRSEEVAKMAESLLEEPFNYEENDYIYFDEKANQHAKSTDELKQKWIKYLKYSILQEIYTAKEEEENANKSFEELEVEARAEVKDYMMDFFRRFNKRKKKDWLSLYINSFTEEYDPHTAYFSPKEKEDFDFNISGQLEGIGARLLDEKGYATIIELIVGGPAWKSNQLEVGDKIIKVAQGENGKPVNIVGMLLDDAIRLIRGKKGSIVVLTIKKADGAIVEVSLERDVIEFDDAFARSAILQGDDGKKYGLILLPEFYANFNDRNGSDASNDVLRELLALKKEGIEGLIFDVRDNGGGSLQEVVEIAGFFIEKGPVVQVQSSGKNRNIHTDKDKSIYWDGPLVVMVNELSASASEILAAALQDYERAVIVGSSKTYGKGTVQSLYALNSFFNRTDDYGALKLTIQKFYRINGESTQLKGVSSDIVIPDKYTYAEISESDKENALDWDEIEGLKYKSWKGMNLKRIKKMSEKRLAKNPIIESLNENALNYKKLTEEKRFPLSYEAFMAEMDKRKKENDWSESLEKYNNQLAIKSLPYEQEEMKHDTVLKTKRVNWHEQLQKDFYLKEAVHVLKDW